MKTLKNLILFLVATVLFIVLGPIGLIYGILTRFEFSLSGFFISLAIGIDQLGNVFCQYLFDDIMITKDGYKFGVEDETISRVIANNYKRGTLKKIGKLLYLIIDTIDPGHFNKLLD